MISDEAHNCPIHEATEEQEVLAEQLTNTRCQSEAPGGTTDDGDNLTIFKLISQGPEHIEKPTDFLDKVKKGYTKDVLFSKMVKEAERYSTFQYRDGLLYTNNQGGHEVLCIPRVVTKDYSLTAIVIEQAHTILGHFNAQKTLDYIHRWYWWPCISPEVDQYCETCSICQANKTSMQRPVGLLHPLPMEWTL